MGDFLWIMGSLPPKLVDFLWHFIGWLIGTILPRLRKLCGCNGLHFEINGLCSPCGGEPNLPCAIAWWIVLCFFRAASVHLGPFWKKQTVHLPKFFSLTKLWNIHFGGCCDEVWSTSRNFWASGWPWNGQEDQQIRQRNGKTWWQLCCLVTRSVSSVIPDPKCINEWEFATHRAAHLLHWTGC